MTVGLAVGLQHGPRTGPPLQRGADLDVSGQRPARALTSKLGLVWKIACSFEKKSRMYEILNKVHL